MFRRKFIFFSQGSSLFVVRNVGNTLLDQSLLSSFSSQNILHRSTVSNTVTLRNIYLVSLFSSTFFLFFFLSCTRPFLSSTTSLILSLSFSLPLFLSHSAHIQLVEKLRQLLHVILSLIAPYLLFRSFLFFLFFFFFRST